MNISYRWLRAIAPTIEDTPERLADRLGMLGAPVDEIIDLGAGLGDIVVARVEEVRPHPNADRLRLCTVRAGAEPLQVVCGAPNVEGGRFYPFAPIGATLPGGMQIKKAKLRGELSQGMLCSPRELGLGRDHDGLMMLTGDWEPGTGFVSALGLDDTRLVLDITPNRPDLLSHIGVARELGPGGVADIVLAPFLDVERALAPEGADRTGSTGAVQITVEDDAGCPRYMAAVVEGVRVAPSPEWLATRLRSVGIRPINNVVDATNYVLHELGQPMHAFDLDRLTGSEVRVRRARSGERITTLDGVERKLDGSELVIADREKPIALAGIMGGEDSEVSAATTRILLECALFDPLTVRKTARGLGLATDASHRFERGVDPEGQPGALRRVVELILAVAGGTTSQPAADVHPSGAPRVRLAVRPSRVRQVLGVELPTEEIEGLLGPIGFEVQNAGEEMQVRVPSYRPDVTREIDVVEEIARRRGYDSFDAELGHFRPGRVTSDPLLGLQNEVRVLFASWGALEARTAAFAPASENRVPLLNPLSAEESHLRDDLTEGLLRRVEHNWSHGVRAVRLFEIGTVFRPNGAVPHEEIRVAAVLTGPASPPHWSAESRPCDVWDIKALVQDALDLVGGTITPGDDGSDAYLSGERFDVRGEDGDTRGSAGRIRMDRLDAPAWADPVYALEVVLRPPKAIPDPTYQPLPSFPPVERDLALVTPSSVTAGQVEEVLRAGGGDLLDRVWPFDVYEGKGIPEGTRSVAWRLRFRHSERTLTDEEVDGIITRTLNSLDEQYGVKRR
ncbi:MAG: phenylalanine--tRNA ligase subunit beta [Gemmatimonadota bacterium]